MSIYWDIDNLSPSKEDTINWIDSIYAYALSLGIPIIVNAYGLGNNIHEDQKELLKEKLNFINITREFKNSTDITIAVDIITSLYEFPEINTYILISNDLDFIPVINKVRKMNKEIIIVGDDQSHKLLKKVPNKFTNYSFLKESSSINLKLKNDKTFGNKKDTISFSDAILCLKVVLYNNSIKRKKIRTNQLDALMRKIDFFEYYGYLSINNPPVKLSSFGNFLNILEKMNIISTHDNFVELIKYNYQMHYADGILLLKKAIHHLHKNSKQTNFQNVAMCMIKLSNGRLQKPGDIVFNNREFGKFKKFVDQAIKDGVIILHQDNNQQIIALSL